MFFNNLSEFTAYFFMTDDHMQFISKKTTNINYQLLGHFATSYKLHLIKHE